MDKELSHFLKSIWIERDSWLEIINSISSSPLKDTIHYIIDKNTVREVEKKVLWIDKNEVIKKLELLWAKKIFEWYVTDNRYDFEWNDLRKSKIIFRIRKEGDKDIVTIKKRADNNTVNSNWKCSINNELESEVSDINIIIKDIKRQWMNIIEEKTKTKYRTSYELDWVHFDFDKHVELWWFVEIESYTEDKVNNAIKKLWLENHKTVSYWIKELLKRKEKWELI